MGGADHQLNVRNGSKADIRQPSARHDRNFVRIHQTLRVTPAMAAGVADRLWEIADIVKLVEDADAAPKKRGACKKAAA